MTTRSRHTWLLGAWALFAGACGPVSRNPLAWIPPLSGYSAAARPSVQGGGGFATYAWPALASATPSQPSAKGVPATVRYRLRLRDNPDDPVAARRCYAQCRRATSQAELLSCIADCPGFEVEPDAVCGAAEGPPRSVCITHRVLPRDRSEEVSAGLVLLAVVADLALFVGLAAACEHDSLGCQDPASLPLYAPR